MVLAIKKNEKLEVNLTINQAFSFLKTEILPKYLPLTSETDRFLWYYLNAAYGIYIPLTVSTKKTILQCFVNAQSNSFNKELNNICGNIELAPIVVRKAKKGYSITENTPVSVDTLNLKYCRLLFDSGAFPEVRIDRRITPEQALDRQLNQYERFPVKPYTLFVSYDRLIDEMHIDGDRVKRRWSEDAAERAVIETIEAARYLSTNRHKVGSNGVVLSCQGVTPRQYLDCVKEVLKVAQKEDTIGLGGWCILGKQKSLLNPFWDTCQRVLPLIAESRIKKVHIFGVTWWKQHKGFKHTPLGSLLYLCDRYGLELSTDGRSPIGNALWSETTSKAGALYPYWRWNLALVNTILACLRDRPEYQKPPMLQPIQLSFFS